MSEYGNEQEKTKFENENTDASNGEIEKSGDDQQTDRDDSKQQ